MIVDGNKVLVKASEEGYGVGAFNIVNMEVTQAVLEAANEEKSPIIIQLSEGAVKYIGDEFIKGFIKAIDEKSEVPVAVHLDHGQSLEIVKKVIDLGFSSVMFDGSKHNFEDNIKLTKEVVDYAHPKGVTVEAELGTIGGVEDNVVAKEIIYTDPEKALEFVEKSGCDSLAVAIGTSHGAYKFKGKTDLNYEILSKIKESVNVPLVLHGASSVPAEAVDRINNFGGNLDKTCGVDDESLGKAISGGISKVNTDTDLRLIWTGSVRQLLAEKPEEFDLRKIIKPAKANLVEYIKKRMQLLGSSGKA